MKYIIKTILASILVFSSMLNASDDYSECITDIYLEMVYGIHMLKL